MSISHLLAAPGTRLGRRRRGGAAARTRGLRLAGLDGAELAQAARTGGARARGVHRLPPAAARTLALPGEPRPEYAPGTGKLQRYRAKAAELQVGVRTVRRWAAGLERDGPAGLVD